MGAILGHSPETNAEVLEVLRAFYLYVLGIGAKTPPTEDISTPIEDIRIHIGDIVRKLNILDPARKLEQDCGFGCFHVVSPPHCIGGVFVSSEREKWVCLGRYGSIHDTLGRQRETIVWESSYNKGVLSQLVMLSLQLQKNAEIKKGGTGP